MLQLEVFGKEEHPNYHDYSECKLSQDTLSFNAEKSQQALEL